MSLAGYDASPPSRVPLTHKARRSTMFHHLPEELLTQYYYNYNYFFILTYVMLSIIYYYFLLANFKANVCCLAELHQCEL